MRPDLVVPGENEEDFMVVKETRVCTVPFTPLEERMQQEKPYLMEGLGKLREKLGPEKFKKDKAQSGFSVSFTANADILRTLAARRRTGQRILGFAAETAADLAACVRAKLASKGADMIVGNRVNEAGSGFGTATNSVLVMDRAGREEQWPAQSKADVAWGLCSWLLSL